MLMYICIFQKPFYIRAINDGQQAERDLHYLILHYSFVLQSILLYTKSCLIFLAKYTNTEMITFVF